jgi:hypothetical protein
VRSIVTLLKSARTSSEPGNEHCLSVAPAKSTSRSTQFSKVTLVSWEARKLTESSLQPLNTTCRSSDPNTCTPASDELRTDTSCQPLSAMFVPVSRTSRIQTSRKLTRGRFPSVTETRCSAHSRKRAFGAFGASKSACSNSTVS